MDDSEFVPPTPPIDSQSRQQNISPLETSDLHDPEDGTTDLPDGGLRAWTTVAGAWLIMFATLGYLYSFGVYQDFYTTTFLPSSSASKIAWIGSLQLMLPFFLGGVSGRLFDSGYFHVVEIVGSLLFVFSLFMLSLAEPDSYYQVFLSQGVGMSIGLGLTFVPTVSLTSHYFKRHAALAYGITLSGSSVGAAVFPIMLNHLFKSIGFSQGVRATAYLVLGCLILGNALVRTRPAPRGKHLQESPPTISNFLRDMPYVWTVLGATISSFGCYFLVIYLQLFAVEHNIDSTLAFYSLSILNGTGIIGRVLGNHMADLWGPYNMQIPCTVIVSALIWTILGIHDTASLVVVSVLYGIFSGAWLSLALATLRSLAASPREVGARSGLSLTVSSFGCLAAAPVQGALLGNTYIWIKPVVFSASTMLLTAVCYAIARTLLVKRRGTWKV